MAVAFIIVSIILFILAACPINSPVALGWLGLAFFAGSFVIGKF